MDRISKCQYPVCTWKCITLIIEADSGDQNLISRVALKKEDLELIKAMTYKPEPKPARGEKTVTVAQGDGTKSMENGVESRDSIWSPEPIENKGRGRIVILHGPPGLGKTYSVECAAAWSGKRSVFYASCEIYLQEESGRPLFRLTCAELGKAHHSHCLGHR